MLQKIISVTINIYTVLHYWLVLLPYTFVISESFFKTNYIFSWLKTTTIVFIISVTKLILPEHILSSYIQLHVIEFKLYFISYGESGNL